MPWIGTLCYVIYLHARIIKLFKINFIFSPFAGALFYCYNFLWSLCLSFMLLYLYLLFLLLFFIHSFLTFCGVYGKCMNLQKFLFDRNFSIGMWICQYICNLVIKIELAGDFDEKRWDGCSFIGGIKMKYLRIYEIFWRIYCNHLCWGA